MSVDYKVKYTQQLQFIKDNYATFAVPYNGEYNNHGAGAATKGRVAWSHQLTKKEAAKVTIKHVGVMTRENKTPKIALKNFNFYEKKAIDILYNQKHKYADIKIGRAHV